MADPNFKSTPTPSTSTFTKIVDFLIGFIVLGFIFFLSYQFVIQTLVGGLLGALQQSSFWGPFLGSPLDFLARVLPPLVMALIKIVIARSVLHKRKFIAIGIISETVITLFTDILGTWSILSFALMWISCILGNCPEL